MPPASHAQLSPSAAVRWLTCTASVHAIEQARSDGTIGPEKTSEFAAEGSKAHALAELKGRLNFGQISKATYTRRHNKWAASGNFSDDSIAEMEEHTSAYVAAIKSAMADELGAEVDFEVKVHPGIEKCWGTSDAVVYTPNIVHIWDFKYGQGVKVSAERNPQLMLYGLGALKMYGDILGETEVVRMSIFQPRLGDGKAHTFEMTAADLRAWGEYAKAQADEALRAPAPVFSPSPSACRWCPLAGICTARMDMVVNSGFGEDPATMTDDQLAEFAELLPNVEAFCKDFRASLIKRLYEDGKPLDGWKAVRGNGHTSIGDSALAIQRLIDSGYQAEDVATFKVKGLGDLSKVVGSRGELNSIIGDLIVKGEGRVQLAPESDKRAAVSANDIAESSFEDVSGG